MKILHVFDHSLPLQSGYTFRSMAILRAQRARGWQTVHLTTPRHAHSAPGAPEREEVDGHVFHRVPASTSPLMRTPLWPFAEMSATARRLEALARAEAPDVLHAHSPSLNAHPALAVGTRLGIPVVYEMRGLWEDAAVDHGTSSEGDLRYRLTRWHETLALRRVQAVTTICGGLKQEIEGRGIPAERIAVVPNAVDTERFRPASPADPALRTRLGLDASWVIGFCGSFYAYEGLDMALRALPPVLQRIPNARLLLVGGGPEDAALRGMVAASGLERHVIFTGRVPNSSVNDYYALINALVFPRKRMRLTELVTPLKPLEAMAMGLPVIASDVGGHRELIRHKETGLLFGADDARALADAIVSLHDDSMLAERLVANGHRFVEAERTWTRSVDNYEATYALALERMGGRAGRASSQGRRAKEVKQ